MLRVGIVGTGFIGTTHAERYREIEGVEVVAAANRSSGTEFVSEHAPGAAVYEDGERLIEAADVDAVDICTPTPTHRDLVEVAAEQGVPTFCEKPVAGRIGDARAIVDAVERAGIPFMVGHVVRFFPAYARIRDAVDDGAIGTLGVARTRRLSPFPDWGSEDWYADEDASGGVLVDLAIHDVDFLRWLFGDVDRVFARSTAAGRHAHTTLRFESGAVGYVEASWNRPAGSGLRTAVELAGEDGLIEYDSAEANPVRATVDGEPVADLATLERDPFRRELEEFVSCVERGVAPSTVTLSDAVESLRVCLAARRSAERGRPVDVTEVGG